MTSGVVDWSGSVSGLGEPSWRSENGPAYESCGVWGSVLACDRPVKTLDYGYMWWVIYNDWAISVPVVDGDLCVNATCGLP